MSGVTGSEQIARLALSRLPWCAGRRSLELVQHFGSAELALEAPPAAWKVVVGAGVASKSRAQPAPLAWATAQWERVRQRGGRLLHLADPEYPELLREIASPPALLFVLGEMASPCVAIVGSRRATPYGLEVAARLARALVARGFGITSGMARGIDAAAHQGALQAGGRTVAVLGCGADMVYPRENAGLHARIRQQGAVVSELPMGSRPQAGSFPRRNRLISGLSVGVVLVEAPAKSGALITANCAREQGREVFAVPGDLRSGMSAGCHRLIRDGAKLVEGVEDIMEELEHLFPRNPPLEAALEGRAAAPAPDLSTGEQRILNHLGGEPRHIDGLAQQLSLATAELLEVLLTLELAGRVTQLPGKRFVKAG